MGWGKGYKNGYWGDEPQDYVDDAIDGLSRNYPAQGKDILGKPFDLSFEDKREILKKLSHDIRLRNRVNAAFQDEWKRKATDDEFLYHIAFGMGEVKRFSSLIGVRKKKSVIKKKKSCKSCKCARVVSKRK